MTWIFFAFDETNVITFLSYYCYWLAILSSVSQWEIYRFLFTRKIDTRSSKKKNKKRKKQFTILSLCSEFFSLNTLSRRVSRSRRTSIVSWNVCLMENTWGDCEFEKLCRELRVCALREWSKPSSCTYIHMYTFGIQWEIKRAIVESTRANKSRFCWGKKEIRDRPSCFCRR